MSAEPDVVIVGGGLAGLAATRRLHRAGVPWRLLEAGDRLGGRVATDRVDGYLLDRGLQVLNTAYPRLGTLLDLATLKLGYFTSGVLVRRGDDLVRLVHPLREPAGAPGTALAGVGSLTDRLRLALLAAGCATLPPRRLLDATETTSETALRQAGLSDAIIEELVRPFLSGVLVDRELTTSSRILAMVSRSFARGRIGLPAEGMGALPRAVAAPLPSAPPEPVVRRELARLYGHPTDDWEHLTTVAVPHALPAASPPQGRLRKPVTLGDGLYVAGDHRDSPSIQGALASGWRAAGALLRALRP
ncbi:FAD-dependent oxidoreductase [Micromonospora sp. NPDC023956]|uniref:FAD-dependent oxidoreductase n=1 Tax=Micromonospora sp. NPDC023956 TaxID=3155722 RepID=UPI0033F3E9DD